MNPPPVTFEDIKELFTSKKFLRVLTKSVNKTSKNGAESAFQVARKLFDSKPLIGRVFDNTFTEFLPIEKISRAKRITHGRLYEGIRELFDKSGNYETEVYKHKVFPLVDYHTHPPKTTSDPSLQDFELFAGSRRKSLEIHEGWGEFYRYDARPLCVIGSVNNKKELEMLVLQEKEDETLSETKIIHIYTSIIDEFRKRFDSGDDEVILSYLDNGRISNSIAREIINELYGFKAENLIFRKNPETKLYEPEEKEIDKLQRFGFNIKLLDKI